MLKLLTSILFIGFFFLNGSTQTTEEKIEDFLGEERDEELKSSNPALILFFATRVDEGYDISESIETKKDSYVEINYVFYKKNQITLDQFINDLEKEGFNILNYTFPNQDQSKTNHYLLGESEILLTVYSNTVINNKVASNL